MKKFILGILSIIVLLATVVVIRTFIFTGNQPKIEAFKTFGITDSAKYHMAEAISIPTISHENPADFDSTAFDSFMLFLERTYPLTHKELIVTPINTYSRIYFWQGRNPDLKPIILMGHLDVVPVPEENKSKWTEDPFATTIKEGVIWGRGAIDDKISVIGNLEAVEELLRQDYRPARSVYLCFGHDEELGGINGAIPIVNHLKNKGVEAEFVLDEGFAITQGLTPGLDKDLALIGTAEKGFVSLTLRINLAGGHSSMPKPESAIDVLSKAIVKLKENPFPVTFTEPVEDFMKTAGPEMNILQRMAFANMWLFKPLIISMMESSPSSNAMIRTTTAPTIIRGGIKENIIPYEAYATINFRVLPGMSIAQVIERVANVIDEPRITISTGSFDSEAPKSSSTTSLGYKMIRQTIHEIFPGVLSSPNLVIGATDSRHYYPLSSNVYRFTPIYLNPETLTTFHGIDERISVADFENAVRYYLQLIKNTTSN